MKAVLSPIILAGGSVGSWPEDIVDLDIILEYNITDDSYTQIGTMTQARNSHAISVVKYEDFSKWCQ